MEDWLGGIACLFQNQNRGGLIMDSIYVGIDISKGSSSAQALDETGEQLFYLSFQMDTSGFAELFNAIRAQTRNLSKVTVAMESTASYHMTLFSFLTSKGMKVFIVNPLLISNFVKMSLRKTKTDKKDAMSIARFLLLNKNSLEQMYLTVDMSELRDLARQRESLVDHMTAVKLDTKRLLNITFPELEKITGLFAKSTLRLLIKYPSAEAVRMARVSDIGKLIISGSRGRNTLEDAHQIKEAAKTSIGTVSVTKEIVIKQKASMLLQLGEHLKEITSVLIKHCQAIMDEDMKILKSIKGIGDKIAVNFLIEMGGDISNFENHRKLIAMSGLDPAVYHSGQYEGKGRISKRGNRHLRRTIWLMTVRVLQFDETFKRYYLKRREDGLPYKKAVLATAHKLIRTIFAMLSKKTFFHANAY
jgi:transposase